MKHNSESTSSHLAAVHSRLGKNNILNLNGCVREAIDISLIKVAYNHARQNN